jgi:malate dehydrogenase (oxaloacetate-decarboxylating)
MSNNKEKNYLHIRISGSNLLQSSLLNKGSAFSRRERDLFNLAGLLPPRYESIDEQAERAYMQYSSFHTNLNKHIYLRNMQDLNETLYYRLVTAHIEEMMPIIYTPTVGDACERFSDIYRTSRGLFISYADRHQMDDILHNATKNRVKIIVVTDGERILGLGDQGIGGMGIPIGKLALYTACGGISPAYTLPVMLDVGTNNEMLRNDPMYMGARHERISQQEYDEFLECFVNAVGRRWPYAMLQFEDFAQANAMPLLERFRDRICCFNDDIQGTAAVTVGTLLAASRVNGIKLSQQRVVFVGAGSAGCGIAEQVIARMVFEGIDESQARSQIYMVDRFGLLTDATEGLRDFQARLVQNTDALANWSYSGDFPSLLDVMNCAQPGILIGVSGQAGLFTEAVIRAMYKACPQPIVFPLSNPSKRIEAMPQDIIEWTDGNALVATGSPFEAVHYEGKEYSIPQCNNSYIFPGIGLGVVAANINLISDEMLMAASDTLAASSPLANTGEGGLLPPLTEVAALSKRIAFAVARVGREQGLGMDVFDAQFEARIERNFWSPKYRRYKRIS